MMRNTMLASAVVLALASASATADQNDEQCADNALALQTQALRSKLSAGARSELAQSLSVARRNPASCADLVAKARLRLEHPDAAAGTGDHDRSAKSKAAYNDEGPVEAMPVRMDTPARAQDLQRLGAMSASQLVHEPVLALDGEQIGKIDAVVTTPDERGEGYAVVTYGGFLGFGKRQVVVGLDKLDVTADGGIQVLGYDPYYFDTFPAYAKANYQPYQGELSSVLQAASAPAPTMNTDSGTDTDAGADASTDGATPASDCADQSACGGSS